MNIECILREKPWPASDLLVTVNRDHCEGKIFPPPGGTFYPGYPSWRQFAKDIKHPSLHRPGSLPVGRVLLVDGEFDYRGTRENLAWVGALGARTLVLDLQPVYTMVASGSPFRPRWDADSDRDTGGVVLALREFLRHQPQVERVTLLIGVSSLNDWVGILGRESALTEGTRVQVLRDARLLLHLTWTHEQSVANLRQIDDPRLAARVLSRLSRYFVGQDFWYEHRGATVSREEMENLLRMENKDRQYHPDDFARYLDPNLASLLTDPNEAWQQALKAHPTVKPVMAVAPQVTLRPQVSHPAPELEGVPLVVEAGGIHDYAGI